MKPIPMITCVLGLFIFLSCSSTKTSPERVNEVTRKIQSKDYTIAANYANPMRGRQIYLTSAYDLRIKNDSAYAYLPYYGVAQVAPLDPSEGGIRFAEPISNYSISPNKKNDGWDIRFNVRSREYNYEFMLYVFNNGNASFTINSYQRDPITFSGVMKDLKDQ